MALKNLPLETLVALLDQINSALASEPKKKTILRVISEAGHCSGGSSGIEVSMNKIAENINYRPENFARIMNAKVLTGPPRSLDSTSPAAASRTNSSPAVQAGSSAVADFLNLRGVAYIQSAPNGSKIFFRDGTDKSVGKPVSSFRGGSLTLIELNG